MQKWTRTWFVRSALALVTWGSLVAQGTCPDRSVIQHYLSQCQILGKATKNNLTLVAIQGSSTRPAESAITTLDEIMPTGKLVITETSQDGNVNTLKLKNNSKQAVFIMAGEILSGSKQDRILQQDVLLPPMSKPISIPAFCVEHGRWVQESAQFYSEKITAPLSVRQKANLEKNQSSVWSEVALNNSKLRVTASTGTLSATYKSGKLLEDRTKYQEAFKSFLGNYPKATGVIVLVNKKVMAADLFGERRIFERLWPKLEDSYIAEAVRRQGEIITSAIDSPEELLFRASSSPIELKESCGMGWQVEVKASTLRGSGISLSTLIHIDLFPHFPTSTPKSDILQPYTEPSQRPFPTP